MHCKYVSTLNSASAVLVETCSSSTYFIIVSLYFWYVNNLKPLEWMHLFLQMTSNTKQKLLSSWYSWYITDETVPNVCNHEDRLTSSGILHVTKLCLILFARAVCVWWWYVRQAKAWFILHQNFERSFVAWKVVDVNRWNPFVHGHFAGLVAGS